MASKKIITVFAIITAVAFLVPGIIGVIESMEGTQLDLYSNPGSRGTYYYHELHWVHVYENDIAYQNMNFEKLWSKQVKNLTHVFVGANSLIAVSHSENKSQIIVYAYNGTEIFHYVAKNGKVVQAAWNGKYLVLVSVSDTPAKKAEISVVSSRGAILGKYSPNWNTSSFDFSSTFNDYYQHPLTLLSSIFIINYWKSIYAFSYSAHPLWNRSYGLVSLFTDSSHIFAVNSHKLITLTYSGRELWNRTMLTDIDYIHIANNRIYVYFSANEPYPMVEVLNEEGKIITVNSFKYISISNGSRVYEDAIFTDMGGYVGILHYTSYGFIVAGASYDLTREIWSVRVYCSSAWYSGESDNVYFPNIDFSQGSVMVDEYQPVVMNDMHGNRTVYLDHPDANDFSLYLKIFTVYWLVLSAINVGIYRKLKPRKKMPWYVFVFAPFLFGALNAMFLSAVMLTPLFLILFYAATPKYRGKEILFSLYYIPYAAIFLHYYPYPHPWEYVYLAAGLIATFAGIYLMDLIYEQNQSLATAK
ncbi:MAG: hypothetical protein GXO25_02075 [Euryarchaeota archaeon]|nr:hypothetical protein [Euryarchaeota archaeon]